MDNKKILRIRGDFWLVTVRFSLEIVHPNKIEEHKNSLISVHFEWRVRRVAVLVLPHAVANLLFLPLSDHLSPFIDGGLRRSTPSSLHTAIGAAILRQLCWFCNSLSPQQSLCFHSRCILHYFVFALWYSELMDLLACTSGTVGVIKGQIIGPCLHKVQFLFRFNN